MNYMKYIIYGISAIAIALYSLIFIDIVKKNFVFDGFFSIQYDFENESPFISLLKPRGRVDQEIKQDQSGDYFQRLLMDPVYFDIELPRSFKKSKTYITYKNPHEPVIELGISSGEHSENFMFQPLDNKLLNNLTEEDYS